MAKYHNECFVLVHALVAVCRALLIESNGFYLSVDNRIMCCKWFLLLTTLRHYIIVFCQRISYSWLITCFQAKASLVKVIACIFCCNIV